MSRALSTSTALVALVLLGAQGAQAADYPTKPVAPAMAGTQEDWYLTIGGSARAVPEYPGSDDYGFSPKLIFGISKASSLYAFRSVDDNPSIALFDTGRFRIGAVGKLDWGRDEDDNAKLNGLGNVDTSIEVGGFAEWYPVDWLRLRGELRYGFGGFEGIMGDLAADVIIPYQSWRLAVGPRVSFAGSGYMQAYYGVTPFQAVSANFVGNPLPVYQAGGGLNAWGATAQLTKNFGNGFEAGVYGSYYRLVGDAADSPLTQSANQFIGGVSLSYTFNMGKSWW
ncbi:MipA/OmpV family protein [Azorhizobium doebereinerae]|uniref:MipA/OmpV family protein n=1 Tax=Azorhizobium doebereinerae TaxID=281091 RepID=UPI0004911541|nr:MipA/OmpV family protein [Azorhizobium doebereinerae]